MKTFWIVLTDVRNGHQRGFYVTAKNRKTAIAAATKYGKLWEFVTECEVQK